MKYMMMTFGEAAEMFETQSTDWIRDMIALMGQFNVELQERGEFVSAEGLVDGREAKTIRVLDGEVVETDGPYAEAKESLVGYWILDVESEERAVELGKDLARRLLALGGGGGGVFELRRVADGPPPV